MAVNLDKSCKKGRRSGLLESLISNPSARFRRVHISKTVRKRHITPLKGKPLNAIRLPDDYIKKVREPNSFVEVTDSSIVASPVRLPSNSYWKTSIVASPVRLPSNSYWKTSIVASPVRLPSNSYWKTSIVASPVRLPSNSHWKTTIPNMVQSPTRQYFLQIFKAGSSRRKALKEAAAYTPWVDAFVIRHAEDILSNVDWKMLKDWMISWSKKLDMLQLNGPPAKKRRNANDDDDYVEGVVKFDEMINTFVVHGPTGCGKTSIVKYCAKKANFDVLELSASDLRSSSALKKVLSGAIENFAVRKANDIRSHFQKATGPQRKMIILIDDADVIFQVDNNFWPKLNALRAESKVPIVLTCTNDSLVMNNLVPADCRTLQFHPRPPTNISEHLLYWFRGYSELNLDEDFVFDIVCDAGQDIRKAVNMLQFYAGSTCYPPKSPDCIKNPLSSIDLAELDASIGICQRLRDELPVKWTAKMTRNLDFGNNADGKERLQKTDIEHCVFPATSSTDVIMSDVVELVQKRKPKIFKDFDEIPTEKAATLRLKRNFDAPVPVAVFDCWKRKEIPTRSDILTTDELFLLQRIHEVFTAKIGKKPLGRRVLHPFDAVDTHLGYCLDIRGNLKSSIREFSDWPDHEPEIDEESTDE